MVDFGALKVQATDAPIERDKRPGRVAEKSPLQDYLTQSHASGKAFKVTVGTEEEAKEIVKEVARAAKQLNIGHEKTVKKVTQFGKDKWLVSFQGANKRTYGGRKPKTAEVTGDATAVAPATETGF